jgi:hypothetical protein
VLVIGSGDHEDQPDRFIIQRMKIDNICVAYADGNNKVGYRGQTDMGNCYPAAYSGTH